MFKKLALTAALGVSAMGAQAASLQYGWEDGVGTVLTSFGSGMQYSNTDALAYEGSRALLIEDINNTSGTPNATLAWITGLTDGDTITASFQAFDTTDGGAPSVRIWGHYTQSSDIDSYEGSAGGNSAYSGATPWTELSHTWTFDSDGGSRDALAIEVRFYDSSSAPTGSALIDDLIVNTSAGAINGPAPVPVPAAVWLFASGIAGISALRRKKKA